MSGDTKKPMRWTAAIALLLIAVAGAVSAKTTAMLQVGVEGRGNADRNRLVLMNSMRGGRDVMLVLSCRVDDPAVLGVAIDFGVGAKWNIDGEQVSFAIGADNPVVHRMQTNEEFLVLGGQPAVTAFRPVLAAATVTFTAPGGAIASFDLRSVANHIQRFRSLCSME